MDGNDEILARIMKKTVNEPVADDGFTAEAIHRVRGRRKHTPLPTRALVLATLAAAVSLAAILPVWDETTALARLVQEKTPGLDGAGGPDVLLAAPLVLAAALSTLVFLLDRLEASR